MGKKQSPQSVSIKLSALVLTFVSLLAASGCVSQSSTAVNSQTSSLNTTKQIPSQNNPQLAAPAAGDTIAILDTDLGTIKFKLFNEQVPEMTRNFIELAKAGKYDGVPFHRVIKDFMIQTGDFTDKNGRGGYSYKGPGTELPDEIVPTLKHLYGTVSMANRGPNTNGSQFFIVTARDGVPMLDGGYTIFGQVYEGMEVAEQIADLYLPQSGQAGTPSKIVNIKKTTVMPYKP